MAEALVPKNALLIARQVMHDVAAIVGSKELLEKIGLCMSMLAKGKGRSGSRC